MNYNLDSSLPQGVIYLQGVSVLFENSRFENLTEYGEGSIVFQDGTVAFTNSSFTGNTQARAGAIFANNTVLSVDDSTFTNNYGFQSGAIQMLGDNSMLYVNGTVFHNNTGGFCFAACRWTILPSRLESLKVHTCSPHMHSCVCQTGPTRFPPSHLFLLYASAFHTALCCRLPYLHPCVQPGPCLSTKCAFWVCTPTCWHLPSWVFHALSSKQGRCQWQAGCDRGKAA